MKDKLTGLEAYFMARKKIPHKSKEHLTDYYDVAEPPVW